MVYAWQFKAKKCDIQTEVMKCEQYKNRLNIIHLPSFLLATRFDKAPWAAPAVNPTIHNSAAL